MNVNYLCITAVAIGIQCGAVYSQSDLRAIEDHPAYLDIDGAMPMDAIQPEVNVNLPRFLINSALQDLEIPTDPSGEEDNQAAAMVTELKDLLSDVKLIRVLVLNKATDNRGHIAAGMPKLHEQLRKSWMPIVSVPEENVGIYAKGDDTGEVMLGMAVVVDEGNNVIIANIVGNVSFGKIFKMLAQVRGGGPGGNPLEALIAPYLGMAAPQGEVHSYDLSAPAQSAE